MVYALQGWLPGDSHVVGRAECVSIGDCKELAPTRYARGLTILALYSRLFFLTVVMTARVVHHG